MSKVDISNNKRHLDIFKKLVEVYVETGEAVGSRSLSKVLDNPLSPATIRNVMADLEEIGILCSEHSSSGRKPTDKGWRFFVNTLLETDSLSEIEQTALLNITKNAVGKSVEEILEKTSETLSGLSNCVSLVLTPTVNSIVRHIDFVLLSPGKAIAIIVDENGIVENRLIEVSNDLTPDSFEQATKYLNSKLSGLTLDEIRDKVQYELDIQNAGMEFFAKDILEKGLGLENIDHNNKVIVKGHSNLIDKANEISALKELMKKLDEKKTMKNILDQSINAKGVQIFIGAETKMFEMEGCSMIVSPYKNKKKKMIGAIGVIGPSRMGYSRVVTLVDYTAKLLSNIM